MISVAVSGASGAMGRHVLRQISEASDLRLAAAIVHDKSRAIGEDAGSLIGRGTPWGVRVEPLTGPLDADVLVDFALPEALPELLRYRGSTPLVTGATGLTSAHHALLDRAQTRAAILLAANFSTGVNALLALVEQAAAALPDFDIEIVEAHHQRKRDAPSGTAEALGQVAARARGWSLSDVRVDGREGSVGARPHAQIGFHALRGGSITGHHTVWLAGASERLQLTHEASDRGVFAEGALRAARWMVGKGPGRFTMRDVLAI